jgi:hypothetical protein
VFGVPVWMRMAYRRMSLILSFILAVGDDNARRRVNQSGVATPGSLDGAATSGDDASSEPNERDV